MLDTVFVNVLQSFNLGEYWITQFKKALKSYIIAADTLYSKNDRNIVVKDAWKFTPLSQREQGHPLYGYGWQIRQQQTTQDDEIQNIQIM